MFYKRIVSSWMKFCVAAGLVCSLVACGDKDRPRPFLDETQMRDLCTDIRIIETSLYENRERQVEISDKVMRERALDVYVPVFKKYGINYEQYQALMRYYMNRPEKMEKILRASADQLAEKVKEYDTEPANGSGQQRK